MSVSISLKSIYFSRLTHAHIYVDVFYLKVEGQFPHDHKIAQVDDLESSEARKESDSKYKSDLKAIEAFDTGFSSDDDDDGEEFVISDSGKIVIVPTMDIPDKDELDREILEDSREAELLIQLKHLNARVEAQDTLLAELKEENTVLKIQNQNLLDSINKVNSTNNKPSLFRKSSKEFQSLDSQVDIFISFNSFFELCLVSGP